MMQLPLSLPSMRYLSIVENTDKPYVLGRVPKPDGSLSQFSKSFNAYGGKEGATSAARNERDQRLVEHWGRDLYKLLRVKAKPKTLNRKPRSDTKSGKVGVCLYYNKAGKFIGFIANWTERDFSGEMKVHNVRFNSGPESDISHETAFILAARERDTQTGQPVLSDQQYLELLNYECMVDKDI